VIKRGDILSAARRRARRAAELSGGSIMVGLSGGKDSLTTLDICCREFERVEAFYMYLVKGLECVERSVIAAADRHKVKLHMVPHWDLARMFKYAVLRPHVNGVGKKLNVLKLRDTEAHLRKETGINWFAYGERGSDSFARWFYTHLNDGVHIPWRRCFPIWDWRDREVHDYVRARKIPVPPRIGREGYGGTSGFNLQPENLAWLQEHYPEDYARVLRVFPYAGSQVKRLELGHGKKKARVRRGKRADHEKAEETEGRGAQQVPEVRDPAGAPEPDQEGALQPPED
jgi:3'-phosphoadenosine 5'-phosphosulfate sulfotransferase (PAPS reductase)/FAD synthetase